MVEPGHLGKPLQSTWNPLRDDLQVEGTESSFHAGRSLGDSLDQAVPDDGIQFRIDCPHDHATA